jgi:hypothetical protein
VNLLFGAKSWQHRRRLRNPLHLAYHGHLPEHPSEKGFLVVADPACRGPAGEIDLVDVAPSLLGLVGTPAPPSMEGRPRFECP